MMRRDITDEDVSNGKIFRFKEFDNLVREKLFSDEDGFATPIFIEIIPVTFTNSRKLPLPKFQIDPEIKLLPSNWRINLPTDAEYLLWLNH